LRVNNLILLIIFLFLINPLYGVTFNHNLDNANIIIEGVGWSHSGNFAYLYTATHPAAIDYGFVIINAVSDEVLFILEERHTEPINFRDNRQGQINAALNRHNIVTNPGRAEALGFTLNNINFRVEMRGATSYQIVIFRGNAVKSVASGTLQSGWASITPRWVVISPFERRAVIISLILKRGNVLVPKITGAHLDWGF